MLFLVIIVIFSHLSMNSSLRNRRTACMNYCDLTVSYMVQGDLELMEEEIV